MVSSNLASLRRRVVARRPPKEWVLNHLINRIPITQRRMNAYARLGVRFENVHVGTIMLGTEVWAPEKLQLGACSVVGRDCLLDARGGLHIGANVNISSFVRIMTARHLIDDPDFFHDFGPVTIHDRAWLALGATVLQDVRIGEGAVVAAGAVVTRDVPDFTVVAGVPAKPVGTRSRDLTYNLAWRPDWL